MPTNPTTLQVLLASPNDVSDERDVAQEVIEDLNVSLRGSNIRIELFRWETHSRPGLGLDAQEVITQQLGDEYDILIGIMWTRFGSPTKRAGSGTEEEFNQALERAQRGEQVEVMFYFKASGPMRLEDIDVDQLKKVKTFKARLQEHGLQREFSDADDFRRQLHMHLGMLVRSWPQSHPAVDAPQPQPAQPQPAQPQPAQPQPAQPQPAQPQPAQPQPAQPQPAQPQPAQPQPAQPQPAQPQPAQPQPAQPQPAVVTADSTASVTTVQKGDNPLSHLSALDAAEGEGEGEGVLDLVDQTVDALNATKTIAGRLTEATHALGQQFKQRTDELNALKDGQDMAQRKRIANNSANDLEHFVKRLSVEIPELYVQQSTGMDALGGIVTAPGTDLAESREVVADMRSGLKGYRDGLRSAASSVEEFRGVVSGMPRLTKNFIRARRRTMAVLDDFFAQLERAIKQIIDVEQLLPQG